MRSESPPDPSMRTYTTRIYTLNTCTFGMYIGSWYPDLSNKIITELRSILPTVGKKPATIRFEIHIYIIDNGKSL